MSDIDFDDSEDDYVPSAESSDSSTDDQTDLDVFDSLTNEEVSSTTTNRWTDIAHHPLQYVFVENTGLKFDANNFTIGKLVDLFFSDEFLTLLVQETNHYASQCIEQQGQVRKSTRLLRWKDNDFQEIKLFLGLLLHMGPCLFPSIEHYWSKSVFYNSSFW